MAMGTGRSSKALHNFTLPYELRWGNQKQMRCAKVNSDGHIAPHGAVDSRRSDQRRRENSVQLRRSGLDGERGGGRESPSEFVRGSHKSSRTPPLGSSGGRRSSNGSDDGIAAVREKLMLDLQTAAERMKVAVFRDGFEEGEASLSPTPPPALPAGMATSTDGETDRPWNLRTRRAAYITSVSTFVPSLNGAAAASGEKSECPAGEMISALKLNSGSPEMKVGESPAMEDRFLRLRSSGTSAIGDKRDRRRFVVALSKAEIEEDLYGMVGHRPARRPKKRARIVQRQLDILFPGLCLKEVKPDMYKVYEAAP